MNIENNNRFKDAVWFNRGAESVIVGGAGGIGSWLTFFLARAGFNPIVYDYDIVEQHNLGGQLFRELDVGQYKVNALAKIVKNFSNEDITTYGEAFTLESPTHHFMFSAFDNMQARKDMFNVWKKSIENCSVKPIFIDGRLLMEQMQIFCVTPETAEIYERDHLFNDEDVTDAPCTLKQTSHSAAIIAGLMMAFFTNHISNIYERIDFRFVPFYHEVFLPTVTIDTWT